MWPQLGVTAVGIWLMAAPAVFGYGGAAAASDRMVGLIVAAIGFVAAPGGHPRAALAQPGPGGVAAHRPWLLGAPATATGSSMLADCWCWPWPSRGVRTRNGSAAAGALAGAWRGERD